MLLGVTKPGDPEETSNKESPFAFDCQSQETIRGERSLCTFLNSYPRSLLLEGYGWTSCLMHSSCPYNLCVLPLCVLDINWVKLLYTNSLDTELIQTDFHKDPWNSSLTKTRGSALLETEERLQNAGGGKKEP